MGWFVASFLSLSFAAAGAVIVHALIGGKGISITWYRTRWGMPYAPNISVA